MAHQPKDNVVPPCSKKKCSINELLHTCGAILECIVEFKGKDMPGVLSVSKAGDNLMRFCVWVERKNGKMLLISRGGLLHKGTSQLKGFIEFAHEPSKATER